jgi:hypothetical protein
MKPGWSVNSKVGPNTEGIVSDYSLFSQLGRRVRDPIWNQMGLGVRSISVSIKVEMGLPARIWNRT